MRRKRKGGFKGMTLQAIADKLNEEGIGTPDRKGVGLVLKFMQSLNR